MARLLAPRPKRHCRGEDEKRGREPGRSQDEVARQKAHGGPDRDRAQWLRRQRDGKGAEHDAEEQHRHAETDRTFGKKLGRSLPFERGRRERARDEEEESHEEGLVDGSEVRQRHACRVGGLVEPAAARAVGDSGVVQDDEHRQAHAQPVNPDRTRSDGYGSPDDADGCCRHGSSPCSNPRVGEPGVLLRLNRRPGTEPVACNLMEPVAISRDRSRTERAGKRFGKAARLAGCRRAEAGDEAALGRADVVVRQRRDGEARFAEMCA